MERAFIGLGSNLGSRRRNIMRAWKLLTSLDNNRELALSSPYLTKPQGMHSPNWFVNSVGLVETALAPGELLEAMLNIETGLGRKRTNDSKDSAGVPEDRTVDLDLLFYGDQVCPDPKLTLPHPALTERLFVLAPLAEIAPGHLHPVTGQTARQMYEALLQAGTADNPDRQIIKTAWHEHNGC